MLLFFLFFGWGTGGGVHLNMNQQCYQFVFIVKKIKAGSVCNTVCASTVQREIFDKF